MARWMLLALLIACRKPEGAPLAHGAATRPASAEALAHDLVEAHGLAVDDTGVYYSAGRKLVRARDSHVYAVDYELEDLSIVDHTLYAIADDFYVAAVPLAGGKPRDIATARGFVSAIAADRRSAVWGTSVPNDPHAGALMIADHGGKPSALASRIGSPEAIALDGDSVFWISVDGVFRMPRDGGAPTRLLDAAQHAGREFLRVHAGKVYVATQDGLTVLDERGGTPRRLVTGGTDTWPDQFVVDTSGVYFLEIDVNRGSRIRCVTPAGELTDVVDDAGDVVALATDPTAVYWLDARDRALLRRAK